MKSIGGYNDVVVGVDKISGVVEIIGRKNKKSPERILEKMIRRWIGRWKNLRILKADQEFVTQESSELCDSLGIILR